MLLALAVINTGCSVGLTRPAPVKRYYMLEAPAQRSTEPALHAAALKVTGFEVAPPFQDRALVFRLDEQRYESDFYNEFFVAPRAMVTARLTEWLSARGLFSAVLPVSSTLDAPYALEGVVNEMYGDLREGAVAVFTMQVFMTQASSPTRRIVHERMYTHRLYLQDRSAESLAKGLSQAFQQCLADLERDLRALQLAQ